MKNWRKLLFLSRYGEWIFEYIIHLILRYRGAGVETYFRTKELSGYLKIPEQSIRRWVLNNEIPFHRIHSVIRYRLSEIETWVEEREKRKEKKGKRN
jgi:excisionase family DNA binding protein